MQRNPLLERIAHPNTWVFYSKGQPAEVLSPVRGTVRVKPQSYANSQSGSDGSESESRYYTLAKHKSTIMKIKTHCVNTVNEEGIHSKLQTSLLNIFSFSLRLSLSQSLCVCVCSHPALQTLRCHLTSVEMGFPFQRFALGYGILTCSPANTPTGCIAAVILFDTQWLCSAVCRIFVEMVGKSSVPPGKRNKFYRMHKVRQIGIAGPMAPSAPGSLNLTVACEALHSRKLLLY